MAEFEPLRTPPLFPIRLQPTSARGTLSRGLNMNLEAHSITLISIIIGLGLTEMFGNLLQLIRDRQRVRWDFLPLAWAATMFFLVLNYWWAVYLRIEGSQEARTAAEFGLLLAPALLLFLATASVLPEFGCNEDRDMRTHYEAQRKVFILTFAVYQVSTFTTALVVGSLGWNFVTLVRLVIFALLISMLFTKSRLWDWISVLTILVILFIRLNAQVVR